MNSLLPLLLLLSLVPTTVSAFECHECHSKDPKMVKMHRALDGRWCFDCHKMGEKLMGKGVPKNREAQLKRRETDPICFECHKKK